MKIKNLIISLLVLTMSMSMAIGLPAQADTIKGANLSEHKTNIKINSSDPYENLVMVYMVGADLESEDGSGTDDLLEMVKGKYNENTAIIVETGGARKWQKDLSLPRISNKENQIYRIRKGQLELLENIGDRNMGDADTLASFITYAMNNYSAKQTTLIMWSHGAGSVYGFGTDEKHEEDGLTLEEMQEAFTMSLHQEKINHVIFDACLMSSLETAHMMSQYADYMMASAEYAPGEGLNYEALVSDLASGKSFKEVTTEDLHAYTDEGFDTIAVSDLSKVKDLSEAYKNILKLLTPEEIKSFLGKSIHYGVETDFDYEDADHFDLKTFGEAVKAVYPYEGAQLLETLSHASIVTLNSDLYTQAGSLSSYLPENSVSTAMDAYENLDELGLSKEYLEIINALRDLVPESDEYEINDYDEWEDEILDFNDEESCYYFLESLYWNLYDFLYEFNGEWE